MYKVISILIIVLMLISCSKTITCNDFDINAKIMDDILYLNIDSDLPDLTNIIITISRSYGIKGDKTDYSLDYKLEEYNNNTIKKGNLSIWENVNKISMNNLNWISKLNSKQKYMDYYNSLDSINDSIIIKIEIPVSQTNSKNIKNNINSAINKNLKKQSFSKSVSINYPLLRKEELLSPDSFIINIDDIPKISLKNHLSISGRVNPNYILFINNEKKNEVDSDKFTHYINFYEGINSITFKVLDSFGKCVFNKNYDVKYTTLETINNEIIEKNPTIKQANLIKLNGKWIDNNGAMRGIIHVYVKNGIIQIETHCSDGSIYGQTAIMKTINKIKRYYVSDSAENEYFIFGKSNEMV